MVCDALKGFADYFVLTNRRAKKFAGNLGNRFVSVGLCARAGHGCRRANTDQLIGLQAFTQASHQERNIRALAATVSMQFIKNQKIKIIAMLNYSSICVFIAR